MPLDFENAPGMDVLGGGGGEGGGSGLEARQDRDLRGGRGGGGGRERGIFTVGRGRWQLPKMGSWRMGSIRRGAVLTG